MKISRSQSKELRDLGRKHSGNKLPSSGIVLRPGALKYTQNLAGICSVTSSVTLDSPSCPTGRLYRASIWMAVICQVLWWWWPTQ